MSWSWSCPMPCFAKTILVSLNALLFVNCFNNPVRLEGTLPATVATSSPLSSESEAETSCKLENSFSDFEVFNNPTPRFGEYYYSKGVSPVDMTEDNQGNLYIYAKGDIYPLRSQEFVEFDLIATGMAKAPDGSLFVAGFTKNYYVIQSDPQPSRAEWIVRKSDPDGKNWTLIDIFSDGQLDMKPVDISISRLGVFVTGYASDSKSFTKLITRRSTDAGKTWQTIDSYARSSTAYGAKGTHVVAGHDGTVIVSGLEDSGGQFGRRAFLRVSRDNGGSWQEIADFDPAQKSSASNAEVTKLFRDSKGNF